ncbi:MAG: hypothetical protein GOV15_04340, partial [Candidatus Diapherotrites archaeon]|nr:hypothetical protein [Candidatus Diapherotrites archaeon]
MFDSILRTQEIAKQNLGEARSPRERNPVAPPRSGPAPEPRQRRTNVVESRSREYVPPRLDAPPEPRQRREKTRVLEQTTTQEEARQALGLGPEVEINIKDAFVTGAGGSEEIHPEIGIPKELVTGLTQQALLLGDNPTQLHQEMKQTAQHLRNLGEEQDSINSAVATVVMKRFEPLKTARDERRRLEAEAKKNR